VEEAVNSPLGAPLSGRHAIVTGGSRGIGAAIAGELARRGAGVSLIGRDPARLETTRRELESRYGGRALAAPADVTDAAEVSRAILRAIETLGPPYALVNNAGAAESAAFLETDDALWRRMLDANLMGAVFCCRAVLPAMSARREGRIVNVASTAGLQGYRFVSAYAAAKHALVGLTRSLALETARDGITVNAVCPGYTDTELLAESVRRATARTGKPEAEIRAAFAAANPQGRLVTPGEVADAVAWLCDPAQAAVTGEPIVVDGGALPR
jgi:NAD(P)-dependent dehydrogenase (short-subunit alcohol dehydrogenase family)